MRDKPLLPNNRTICDICHKQFLITKSTLKEEEVWLEKASIKYKAVLTFLQCPHCGKRYVVLLDDLDTCKLAEKARSLASKRIKQAKLGFSINPELSKKYYACIRKLNFKRQQLAKEFDGAFYQIEGDTIQLDYRYHAR